MLLEISSMTSTIISSIVLFLGVSILLVVILLVAKKYLVPSGKATITINNDKQIEVETGSSLLSTLSNEKNIPAVGLRRRRLMCPMPLSGIGRRGRNFTDRTSTLLPETTTEPLAAGLSGESEKRHENNRSRIGIRCKRMGM